MLTLPKPYVPPNPHRKTIIAKHQEIPNNIPTSTVVSYSTLMLMRGVLTNIESIKMQFLRLDYVTNDCSERYVFPYGNKSYIA